MRCLSTAAAAIALFTTGILSTEVHIAYQTEDGHYRQVLDPRHLTQLDHPGNMDKIYSTANCLLRAKPNGRVRPIKTGVTAFNPPRYVAFIFCNEPSTVSHKSESHRVPFEESLQEDIWWDQHAL
ncbi:hypothetical protein BDV25DRAFT_137098 [Aspergillus avenaceus]|uniref:Uncharacterized protein n=1 Tax=Aspergillus avenaceus TaxID=36643 RepID=A0A5N6U3P4_ASPAV|nr:hypothetical protein BDV25DRAFT_137098 [Aspergillus avenaceus]